MMLGASKRLGQYDKTSPSALSTAIVRLSPMIARSRISGQVGCMFPKLSVVAE
jgi:hypothetical protein